jgi:hypothetical protein
MPQNHFKIYEQILAELQAQYKNVPGIIEVQSSDFFTDEVVVLIDKDLLSIRLPEVYKNVQLVQFDLYENYKQMSLFIDNLIINEFSLWEYPRDTSLNSLFSLCDLYKEKISTYERDKKYAISFLR